MDKNTYDIANRLFKKLKRLQCFNETLQKAENVHTICFFKESYYSYGIRSVLELYCDLIDFTRIKDFLIEEVNKEISVIQKEFDEL